MKFQIISVGKKNDKNLENYILDFEKRIKTQFDIEWMILKPEDDQNKKIQIEKESQNILRILNKNNNTNIFKILLDEEGKQKNNLELASVFQEKMNQGLEKIIFIIGGSFGVSHEIFKNCDLVLSFSKLIFPHQLVRAILIEQIYRSLSILNNSKYHHIKL